MFSFLKTKNNKNNDKNLETNNSSQSKNQNNVLCSVNVELMYDGTISIRYFWPKFDSSNGHHIQDISHDFGTLLYMINNGLLEKDMVETLSHTIDKNNIFDKEFTEGCLIQWLNNINHNSPVISPSKVFGQYHQ